MLVHQHAAQLGESVGRVVERVEDEQLHIVAHRALVGEFVSVRGPDDLGRRWMRLPSLRAKSGGYPARMGGSERRRGIRKNRLAHVLAHTFEKWR
jgi:hypothetical protein